MRIPVPVALFALLALSCAGCATYEPAPLDPEAILAREIERRTAVPAGRGLTLAEAVAAMRENNPRIREARAAHRSAAAAADIPTPPANPELTLGPLFLDGEDILGSARWGVEAALGWAVPLSGTRARRDDLNHARAHAALVEAAGAEREEYLRLRGDLAAVALLGARLEARRQVAKATLDAAESARRLVEAARATALDVRLLEVEAARAESAVLGEEEDVLEARSKLAARAGLALAAFDAVPPDALAPLPASPPPDEELNRLLLAQHPGLAALRARYVVAEQALRLEVARQYPTLGFGPSYEREDEVDRFGFPFAVELPLFDRNQQAIAAARAERDEIRARFEASVAVRLGEIEAARTRVGLAARRVELLSGRIGPLSEEALELARRSLPAGAIEPTHFLEVLRTDREVHFELATARLELYGAWLALEQACGAPILRFPGDPGTPPLPEPAPREDPR